MDFITFKGGTSLSKAFNLISRFSEDIDPVSYTHLDVYKRQSYHWYREFIREHTED